jgi:hypothetical protein
MQIISLVWGIIALIGMLIGLIPCLGSLNWINIPFAVVGLIISMTAYSSREPYKTPSMLGVIFCSVAVAFGIMRLIAGCGVL